MAVTDWKNPSTAINEPVGVADWVSPTNALTSNNSRTRSTVSQSGVSDFLVCTNYFTVADIPAGSTIDGIEVQVENQSEAFDLLDNSLRLHSGGADIGDNKANTDDWGANDSFALYPPTGGATDMWGTSLTQADLISSGFGVSLQAINHHASFSTWGEVDVIQCRVHYTEAPPSIEIDATSDTLTTTNLQSTVAQNVDSNIAGVTDSLAVSPQQTGISLDIVLPGSVAALVITGDTAEIEQLSGINVSAITNSLSIAEQISVIDQTNDIAGITNSLSISGQSASVSQDIELLGISPSLILTNLTASVEQDNSIAVDGITDNLGVSEQLSVIVLDATIPVAANTLSLTGYSAGIDAGNSIAASNDALVINAQPSAVSTSADTTTLSQLLSVTPQSAIVFLEGTVSANSHTLGIVPQPTIVEIHTSVDATTASLSVTGNISELVFVHSINGLSTPINVTGRQAAVALDYTIQGDTANLLVTANQAVASGDRVVNASPDTISINNHLSIITFGHVLPTQTDSLRIFASGAGIQYDSNTLGGIFNPSVSTATLGRSISINTTTRDFTVI